VTGRTLLWLALIVLAVLAVLWLGTADWSFEGSDG
jgi:hypothetical protein